MGPRAERKEAEHFQLGPGQAGPKSDCSNRDPPEMIMSSDLGSQMGMGQSGWDH